MNLCRIKENMLIDEKKEYLNNNNELMFNVTL